MRIENSSAEKFFQLILPRKLKNQSHKNKLEQAIIFRHLTFIIVLSNDKYVCKVKQLQTSNARVALI